MPALVVSESTTVRSPVSADAEETKRLREAVLRASHDLASHLLRKNGKRALTTLLVARHYWRTVRMANHLQGGPEAFCNCGKCPQPSSAEWERDKEICCKFWANVDVAWGNERAENCYLGPGQQPLLALW